jgi:hypothetical protein
MIKNKHLTAVLLLEYQPLKTQDTTNNKWKYLVRRGEAYNKEYKEKLKLNDT